jgi:hypothetical protein
MHAQAIRRALSQPARQARDLLQLAFALTPNPLASGYMPAGVGAAALAPARRG